MRGGKQPGAGRPLKPEGEKVRRFLVSLSPKAAAKWEVITPGERSAMVERMLLFTIGDAIDKADAINNKLGVILKSNPSDETMDKLAAISGRIDKLLDMVEEQQNRELDKQNK
jgi:hypothetical protein